MTWETKNSPQLAEVVAHRIARLAERQPPHFWVALGMKLDGSENGTITMADLLGVLIDGERDE
ncbi:hypothetical protein QM996_11515 [Sinorhizobium chiapasense]